MSSCSSNPFRSDYRRLQLDQLDSLEILSANNYTNPFPLHFHDTFCISLISKGTFVENDCYATTGSICITNPMELHANQCLHETGVSFKTFYISPDLIKSLNQGKSVFFNDKVINNPGILNRLNEVATRAAEGMPDSKLLQEQITELIKISSIDPAGTPPQISGKITEIKDHIKRNLNKKMQLDQLASIAGTDKYKLIRSFKKHTGLTPYGYVLLQRIEKSKKLLKQNAPLALIALDCGFYDQSHFNNYFREFTGTTPSKYQAAIYSKTVLPE